LSQGSLYYYLFGYMTPCSLEDGKDAY